MADAMVTARMSATKKEAGTRVLESLGSNASQVINELFDLLIDRREIPWRQKQADPSLTHAQLSGALAWVDGLQVELSPEYANMSIEDARQRRLGLHPSRVVQGDEQI